MKGITSAVIAFAIAMLAMADAGCSSPGPPVPTATVATLDRYLAQYAPYAMEYDATALPERDRQMLGKLIEAGRILDTLYWIQTSTTGLAHRDSLEALPPIRPNTPDPPESPDRLRDRLLKLLERNHAPWDKLRGDTTFIGTEQINAGKTVYPPGLTAEQFDAYVAALPEAERAPFMSPYTVIRSDGKGGYRAVPYHEEYAAYIAPMAQLLREAADLSDHAGFTEFLRKKAQALQTDQYFDVDTAWIGLEGNPYDIVFGPFETYSDGVKGVKAAYEAYIEIVDPVESKRLDLYKLHLNSMEQNLPVPDVYKSTVKGLTANFTIVRDIYRGGEAAAGYQSVAANLPNDAEVHLKKGSKKTFWRNMFTARFEKIIKPVSLRLIHPEQLQYLTGDGFFQFVLMHEICHALGPRVVKTGPNKGMQVNASIGPDYSPLEECKADIAGLHSLNWLMSKDILRKNRAMEFYVSYLGACFRSVRFGMGQAHGKAALIALNYLSHSGAIGYDPATKRWSVVPREFPKGIAALAKELVILEGDGDPKAVSDFFAKWTTMPEHLRMSLDAVSDLPTDVMPTYTVRWN